MSDEKLAESMSEARLISASDNVIFPMIKKMIDQKIERACGRFENGDTNFLAEIASIAAMKEIERSLRDKILQGNKAVKALHERQE